MLRRDYRRSLPRGLACWAAMAFRGPARRRQRRLGVLVKSAVRHSSHEGLDLIDLRNFLRGRALRHIRRGDDRMFLSER